MEVPVTHLSSVPLHAARKHAEKISEDAVENSSASTPNSDNNDQFSLNDDRRVKTLSPGALVARRFFRNRLAVVGLSMLLAMFIFSFIGGMLSPYGEDEQFYTYTNMDQEYVGVVKNDALRFAEADGQSFGSTLQAQLQLAVTKEQESFSYKGTDYTVVTEGPDLYTVYQDGVLLAMASKDLVNASEEGQELPFDLRLAALRAYVNEEASFAADGIEYTMDEDGNILAGDEMIGYVSRFVVRSKHNGVVITREFKDKLEEAIDNDEKEFHYKTDGTEHHYTITYQADSQTWSVLESQAAYVYDRYGAPSREHWLGTDTSGMDMLTRLMYGGRVSLIIGFIVVIIETVLGVILGGISGYFGGWVDNLIMRIVDVFYCIPSMPLIIILGATMDAMQIDPKVRMLLLMLILGFLGWPGIARLVRGQILSLREQEFMTATEACGISVSRRILRHLIPNVIPQLIVICTMSLGSVILTEATLSFLGLGVKFPFASWGNIINDVTNAYVMINYWFIWIPAGICLLITVLGFNFVGDGLRDAFDPKMKR
ncbi:MAG: ABC transporter permease [Oscillospiraceae bacterium]|nr:ABC transporter permease [Oscillospiraceae bacterium]